MGTLLSAQTYFTPNAGQWSNPSIARNLQAFGSVFIETNGFKIKQVDPDAALKKTSFVSPAKRIKRAYP